MSRTITIGSGRFFGGKDHLMVVAQIRKTNRALLAALSQVSDSSRAPTVSIKIPNKYTHAIEVSGNVVSNHIIDYLRDKKRDDRQGLNKVTVGWSDDDQREIYGSNTWQHPYVLALDTYMSQIGDIAPYRKDEIKTLRTRINLIQALITAYIEPMLDDQTMMSSRRATKGDKTVTLADNLAAIKKELEDDINQARLALNEKEVGAALKALNRSMKDTISQTLKATLTAVKPETPAAAESRLYSALETYKTMKKRMHATVPTLLQSYQIHDASIGKPNTKRLKIQTPIAGHKHSA